MGTETINDEYLSNIVLNNVLYARIVTEWA